VALSVPAPGIVGRGWPLFWMIMATAALGAAGALVVLRLRLRTALLLVVLAGILLPVVSLAPKAPLSDDLYRYAWDGDVQAHGIDPYRYTPRAPQLDDLHTSWIWPSVAECRSLHRRDDCTLINRADDHTIYPPVAEVYFLAIHETHLYELRDRGVELAGLLVTLALLAAMLALLRAEGRDPRLAAFWALGPMAALEMTSDAHVDGLAALLSVLAFLALRRHRPLWAAALVSLAALTKLYPALLLVAIVQRRWQDALRQIAVFGGVFVVGYAPHVAVVGGEVIGYLPGYLSEEHYDAGTRYLVLDLFGLTGHVATAAVVLLMAAVVLAVLRWRPEPLVAATVLYGALLLLTTPVQPWYAVGLGALCVCAGRPEWLAVGIAGYAPYFAAVLNDDIAGDGRLSYGLAAAFVLAVSVWRLRAGPRAADRSRTPSRPPRIPSPAGTPAR
jgi:hypothetical protein